MKIEISNSLYNALSRLSRYWLPFLAALYILATYLSGESPVAKALAVVLMIETLIGLLLWLVRRRWMAKDTLIIDDRDLTNLTMGFESGRRLEELQHGKIMTLRIRKLGSELREQFGAYGDHNRKESP